MLKWPEGHWEKDWFEIEDNKITFFTEPDEPPAWQDKHGVMYAVPKTNNRTDNLIKDRE